MIVCKFGGTSVGTADRFLATADRVVERRDRGCLAVVSAMSRVTRELDRLAVLAGEGRLAEARGVLEGLRERHREAIVEAGVAGGEAAWALAAVDDELARVDELAVAAAAGGALPEPARDAILATGELLSSRVLAAVLRSLGVDVEWIDPRDLVATDDRFGHARPDEPEIGRRVAEQVGPVLTSGRVVVTGGFVGRAPGGETTILGWEASDYSATLLGAALPAELVEIFSDVDGVYTADPRLVPAARLVPRMSYAEATDLAFFGAKVLHPATMVPVARRGVPVRIRNSFRPEHEGTLVSVAGGDAGSGPRAVAARGELSAARLRTLVASACGARLLDELEGDDARRALAGEVVMPVHSRAAAELDVDLLAGEAGDLETGLALVAVVGGAWRPEVSATVETALADLPHLPVARNGCPTHRCFAVAEARRREALERLERALCEEAPR